MSHIKRSNVLIAPTDPRWWDEREVTQDQILAYLEAYKCTGTSGKLDFAMLFALNPRLCEIFARKLSAGIPEVFRRRREPLPKTVTGSSFFAFEVAKAMGMSYLSDLCMREERFLRTANGEPILRVYNNIYYGAMLKACPELNFSPVVCACSVAEDIEVPEGIEIISLLKL